MLDAHNYPPEQDPLRNLKTETETPPRRLLSPRFVQRKQRAIGDSEMFQDSVREVRGQLVVRGGAEVGGLVEVVFQPFPPSEFRETCVL